MIISSTYDYRLAAQRRLPPFLFHYIDGGAYEEHTLARNVADLRDLALRQRVLKEVGDVDLSARLFGEDVSLPVALAPVGLTGMYARRGADPGVHGGYAGAGGALSRSAFGDVRALRGLAVDAAGGDAPALGVGRGPARAALVHLGSSLLGNTSSGMRRPHQPVPSMPPFSPQAPTAANPAQNSRSTTR